MTHLILHPLLVLYRYYAPRSLNKRPYIRYNWLHCALHVLLFLLLILLTLRPHHTLLIIPNTYPIPTHAIITLLQNPPLTAVHLRFIIRKHYWYYRLTIIHVIHKCRIISNFVYYRPLNIFVRKLYFCQWFCFYQHTRSTLILPLSLNYCMNAIHPHGIELSQLSQVSYLQILHRANGVSPLVYWQFMSGDNWFDRFKGD